MEPNPPSPTWKPTTALSLLALFAFYGCVTVWLTWPLGADPREHLPCTNAACRFDTRYSAWVLAWQSHALATPAARLADANIFHPAADALYYGPAGFGALPYFVPTFLATGSAALATNVMLLLSATLSALSLHWVVRRWTGLESAGLVAAATLLLQRWYLWGFVATTPHLAPIQYFPLIVWLAALPSIRAWQAVLLVVLIVAQCLTDPVYVAAAVVAPLSLLAAARIVRPRWRRDGLVLAGVLAASLVGLGPFLLGYLRVRAQNPSLGEQTLWNHTFVLSDLTSLGWRYPAATTIAPAALLLILLGGLLTLVRRRRVSLPHDPGWAHGALWLLVGVLISLTPIARWGGREVYLPQQWLAMSTPLYEIIRVPSRLGVAALIGACVLSGVAFAEVAHALVRPTLRRSTIRAARGGLAVLVVTALYLIAPAGTSAIPASYPLQQTPSLPPSFLDNIVKRPGPLLQLPAMHHKLRTAPSPEWNAQAMYLSTFHWQPLLNGYSSYWPDGFPARMELAEQLPARAALARLVKETGVRMIWVDLRGYASARRVRWLDAQLGLVPGFELRAQVRSQLLFEVDPALLGSRPGDGS